MLTSINLSDALRLHPCSCLRTRHSVATLMPFCCRNYGCTRGYEDTRWIWCAIWNQPSGSLSAVPASQASPACSLHAAVSVQSCFALVTRWERCSIGFLISARCLPSSLHCVVSPLFPEWCACCIVWRNFSWWPIGDQPRLLSSSLQRPSDCGLRNWINLI